jgi:histone acetyltransferase (RNA polymerase elongator complex component)
MTDVSIPHFQSVLSQLVEDVRRTSMPGEIAFYGGTFTALPMNILEVLLGEASRYVEEGIFTGVRFSTRPDAITPDIRDFLSNYPVRTIELGVQSFSDDVLSQSRRGYSAQTVRDAAGLVRGQGWELGIQLMPGLPGDTVSLFMESVRSAIALQPALVRLYPTVVLSQTPLAEWYHRGKYRPLTLEEALEWCALAYDALLDASIPAARMGLHADPELEKPGRILAGPYHPAFGYLVRVRWWRNRVDECLKAASNPLPGKGLIIRVPRRFVSEAIGARQSNLTYWQSKWRRERIRVQGVEGWSGEELECCWE